MTDTIDAGGCFPLTTQGRVPVKVWFDEHWIVTMLLVSAAVLFAAGVTVAIIGRTLG